MLSVFVFWTMKFTPPFFPLIKGNNTRAINILYTDIVTNTNKKMKGGKP